MNSVYRYDGTFEGFACAVVCALERDDRRPEFVRDGAGHAVGLFDEDPRDVPTVRETARNFQETFTRIVSREAFATARYAFHSQKEDIEALLWRYFLRGLEVGPRLAAMLAVEPVQSVHRTARTVAREAHRFKGFVRFREVAAGFLFARIEPAADILPFIAPHFVERVGDRPWVIHDLVRSQAAVFDLTSWRLVREIELAAEPELTTDEQAYAALWQRYFQRLAIAERHNPKLQQNHVPLRCRKHLTEFTDG